MIVLMHAPLPTGAENGLFLSALSYLTAPGVGLFFMISGALLLPVKIDTGTFLKKRFSKIVIPTLVWTVIYLIAGVWTNRQPLDWKEVLSIPFSAQGNPTFWFLYTLMGLYLLAPILSRWLESVSRKELECYLLLWGISLCYPLLRLFLDINSSETGILYYFTGFAGYFLLGHYLMKYPERIRFHWLIPLTLIAYAVPVGFRLKGMQVDFYSVFWYLSILVTIQCIFIWKLVMALAPAQGWRRSNVFLARIASLSFGIYLIHFIVIRQILWTWAPVEGIRSYLLQTFVIAVAAFALSLAISFLVSLLPGARYLLGIKGSRLSQHSLHLRNS